MFSIVICRQSGDTWQSKTLFLTLLDLRSSIVYTFSIAAYPLCLFLQVKCRPMLKSRDLSRVSICRSVPETARTPL